MSSSKEYLNFVLDELSNLDNISYRPMMGEYIIYYDGVVIGGIYDDRFLVKKTPTVIEMIPNPTLELPYEGGKEMVLVDVDDKELLNILIPLIANDISNKIK